MALLDFLKKKKEAEKAKEKKPAKASDAKKETVETAPAAAKAKAGKEKSEDKTGKVAVSYLMGKLLAEKAKAKGVSRVKFDRGGYRYHGRVKALADGAREGGLIF